MYMQDPLIKDYVAAPFLQKAQLKVSEANVNLADLDLAIDEGKGDFKELVNNCQEQKAEDLKTIGAITKQVENAVEAAENVEWHQESDDSEWTLRKIEE